MLKYSFDRRDGVTTVPLLIASTLLAAGMGMGQEPEAGLTPRQLFFTTRPAPTAIPKASESPAATSAKSETVPPATTRRTTKRMGTRPKTVEAATSLPGATESPMRTAQPPAATPATPANIVPYLGLRYSILQPDSRGEWAEVDPEKVFRSGERFRMKLTANDAAYLYVVHQAAQGYWDVLIPARETEHGPQRVEAQKQIFLPGEAHSEYFYFDPQPGAERLFIVLTKEPQGDLGSLLETVRQRKSSPAGQSAANRTEKPLSATSGSVSDADMNTLRTKLQSRGIKIGRENARSSSSAGENGVYIVNIGTSADTRVIADITLKHE